MGGELTTWGEAWGKSRREKTESSPDTKSRTGRSYLVA